MHQDPVAKSKRVTDAAGVVTSRGELDPWGGDTVESANALQRRRQFTSYERDGDGSGDAMMRRYNRQHARFDQPDPYDGSYDLSDPIGMFTLPAESCGCVAKNAKGRRRG